MHVDEFLSPRQVATWTGFSLDWVYDRVKSGDFPNAWKVDRNIRIPRKDVLRYIERNNELTTGKK